MKKTNIYNYVTISVGFVIISLSKQQSAVAFFHLYGYHFDQISSIMKISKNTVRQYTKQLRNKLLGQSLYGTISTLKNSNFLIEYQRTLDYIEFEKYEDIN